MKTCLIGNTALYITSLNVAEFDFLLPSFQNANAFRVVPTIPSMQADETQCRAFHQCKLIKTRCRAFHRQALFADSQVLPLETALC